MAEEKVGIKAGITAKLEKRDEEGKVVKTTFYFPDMNVRVEAANLKEATKLAKEKVEKQKSKK